MQIAQKRNYWHWRDRKVQISAFCFKCLKKIKFYDWEACGLAVFSFKWIRSLSHFFCRSLFYLFSPVLFLVWFYLTYAFPISILLGNLSFGDCSDQIKALHVGFIVCVYNPLVHCNYSYDNFFIHISFSRNAVIENHRLETEIYHDCAT